MKISTCEQGDTQVAIFTDALAYNLKNVDCLQSAFSLKIRLVLISSSAIANHDVIIFSSRAYALISRGKRLRRSRI